MPTSSYQPSFIISNITTKRRTLNELRMFRYCAVLIRQETAGCKAAERLAHCVRFPPFTSKINHLTENFFLSFFNTVAFDGLSYGFLMRCTLPLVFSTDLKPCKNCRIKEHKGLLWSWMQKTKQRETERGEEEEREREKERKMWPHSLNCSSMDGQDELWPRQTLSLFSSHSSIRTAKCWSSFLFGIIYYGNLNQLVSSE